jgi:cytochrome c-type biogenesis protein CcmE
MNRYLKFGIPVAAILATLAWLGFSSTKATAEHFVYLPELKKMGAQAQAKRLQVDGYVKEGSIVSAGQTTTFMLVEHEGQADLGEQLKVVYTGNDLPDTFKAHAEAVAGGQLDADGVLRATKLQAKCASKYEGAPPKLNASNPPANKI